MTSPIGPSTPADMDSDNDPVTAPPGGWASAHETPAGWASAHETPAGWASAQQAPAEPVPPAGAPAAPRTSRKVVVAVVVVALLIAIAVVGSTVLFRQGRLAGPAAPAHTVSGPLAGAHDGEFQLLTGVTAVDVHLVDLGTDLYQVSTPRDSGVLPSVQHDGGRLQLYLNKTDGVGPATVDVRLSSRVRWQLRLIGGSTAATVDARGANLAGVDFVGGVTRIEVWLPRPSGVLVARMAGGASEYVVHAVAQVPVRARIGSGASTVTVDSATHSGIAPGTAFTPSGWESATDRYDVDATGGVATLTVDRY